MVADGQALEHPAAAQRERGDDGDQPEVEQLDRQDDEVGEGVALVARIDDDRSEHRCGIGAEGDPRDQRAGRDRTQRSDQERTDRLGNGDLARRAAAREHDEHDRQRRQRDQGRVGLNPALVEVRRREQERDGHHQPAGRHLQRSCPAGRRARAGGREQEADRRQASHVDLDHDQQARQRARPPPHRRRPQARGQRERDHREEQLDERAGMRRLGREAVVQDRDREEHGRGDGQSIGESQRRGAADEGDQQPQADHDPARDVGGDVERAETERRTPELEVERSVLGQDILVQAPAGKHVFDREGEVPLVVVRREPTECVSGRERCTQQGQQRQPHVTEIERPAGRHTGDSMTAQADPALCHAS